MSDNQYQVRCVCGMTLDVNHPTNDINICWHCGEEWTPEDVKEEIEYWHGDTATSGE